MSADGIVTVRRGGSYLTIPELAIDRYMAKGYDVVDESGNVLQASIPNDINVLQTAYKQHISEIKALKERIAELENQNTKAGEIPAEEPEKSTVRKTTRKSK